MWLARIISLGSAICAMSNAFALGSSAKPEKRTVYVGIYLADISGFDLTKGRFRADFQLWVKWLGDDRVPPISLANGEVDKMEKVAEESDGDWRSVRWRVQGTFRGTFPLQRFPFDKQRLRIQIDLPEHEGELEPDLAGSGMAPRFSITGWLYDPYFLSEKRPSTYYSDFGSIQAEGRPLKVESLAFAVKLGRPLLAYIIKFMVPLVIILVMAMLAFFIRPDDIEVRGTIGVTALLSCVAFQFSQADSLPDVAYLMTVDKVFLGSYLLILLGIIETVIAYHQYGRRPGFTRWLDRVSYLVFPVLIALAGLLLVSGRSPRAGGQAALRAGHADGAKRHQATDKGPLVISVAGISSLFSYDELTTRGMYHYVDGKRVAHLAAVVPKPTNTAVRFLPDGGMVVRWQLKPALRWSDGKPLSSRDLRFSVEIYEEPERRAIRVIDARTIELEFSQRLARFLTFPEVLAAHHLEPIYQRSNKKRAAIWKSMRSEIYPCTGPYQVKRFEKDKRLVLERNPHFAGKPAHIETIIFAVDRTRTVADKLKSGASHLAGLIGPQSYEALQNWPGAKTRSDRYDRLAFLQPDLSQPPYNDVTVRRAILHAIDRVAAGKLVYGDEAMIADSFRPPWAEDYNADVVRYAFDRQKSRELLKKAGYSRPPKLTVIASFQLPGAPERLMLEKVVDDLRTAGFTVELQWKKGSTFDLWAAGNHKALLYYARSGSDPARYFNIVYDRQSGFELNTPTRLFSAEMLGMYSRRRQSLFGERRIALSRQMQRYWANTLPVIPLVFGANRSAHVTALSGWNPYGGGNPYWNVESWRFRPSARK
ncbi:MAG: hypothetical protein H6707_16855 [Deltaproteobacteria bacterium]|nr:hypothetical protein [Deltaproteobacteria bacterium]